MTLTPRIADIKKATDADMCIINESEVCIVAKVLSLVRKQIGHAM